MADILRERTFEKTLRIDAPVMYPDQQKELIAERCTETLARFVWSTLDSIPELTIAEVRAIALDVAMTLLVSVQAEYHGKVLSERMAARMPEGKA